MLQHYFDTFFTPIDRFSAIQFPAGSEIHPISSSFIIDMISYITKYTDVRSTRFFFHNCLCDDREKNNSSLLLVKRLRLRIMRCVRMHACALSWILVLSSESDSVRSSVGVVDWNGHGLADTPLVPDLLSVVDPPEVEFQLLALGQFDLGAERKEDREPAEHA